MLKIENISKTFFPGTVKTASLHLEPAGLYRSVLVEIVEIPVDLPEAVPVGLSILRLIADAVPFADPAPFLRAHCKGAKAHAQQK